MKTLNRTHPRLQLTGQKVIVRSQGLLKNILGWIFLASFAVVLLSACSGSIDAPFQPKKGVTISHMIVCDANNYCESDGGNDGVGPQTLSLFIHTGCVHNDYQHIAGTCPVAPNVGITGGTPGSSYNVAWYRSYCSDPLEPSCAVFDTLNTGKLVFTSSDYEIDLMAQVQEVGGNGLTGVGVVFVMGPASETGSQVGCTGANASDDIINKFPNYEPARDADTFLVLHDGAGNELFKNFARNPCTGSVVFSPDDPHSM